MTQTACVLYVDHQGHPAPLSRCYHATASRRLSSSVDRHPPSTKTEVDSAYCPQCLSFHDAATAASLGHCTSCKQCPLCKAVACVAVNNGIAFYKCGYCSWTSHACQVTAAVTPAEDGSIGKEQLLKAKKDLEESHQSKLDESVVETHYRDMLSAWEKVVKDRRRPKQEKIKRGVQPDDAWSLQALEESIQIKQEREPPMIGNAHRVPSDEQPLDDSFQSLSSTTLLLQPLASSRHSPSSIHNLLPLPIPLRARKSRRCRAELAEGRPGILVKPKLNPLEGDSSLRSGHGQWWKKDSSAIHVVPKITVVTKEGGNFLLKVSNPTMGMVRVRLGPSTYQGGMMKQVLMDSLKVLYADLVLDPQATSKLTPTDFVELESVEDSFLDLGKTSRAKLPDAITSWTPTQTDSSVQLVAVYKDTAWFELIVLTEKTQDEQVWTAAPIALQIQVGEGSWESSLIKSVPSESPDLVTFDVLIAWGNKGFS